VKKKAIIITGAGRRVGRTLALHCAQKGFAVIAHYHASAGPITTLKKAVKKIGQPFFSIQADLSKDTKTFIPRCLRFPTQIFGLVNNASVFEKGNLLNTSPEAALKQLQVNAITPLLLSQSFAKHIKKGVIINFLDAAMEIPNAAFQIYRLSKKIFGEITADCARLFAPEIRVNAIAPGALLPSKFDTAKTFKEKQKRAPLKGSTSQQSLIAAFNYLLSEKR